MTVKLPPDVQAKLHTTIRHVQQDEIGAARLRARELGEMLGALPRLFDKHTGHKPSDAIQEAWSHVVAVNRALVDAGGQGGPMATRVLSAFDEVVRASPNEAIRTYNAMMMKEARG